MITKLMSKTRKHKRIGDVLLKSRMREIFKSGSVRGLIVTLGLLPHKKVAMGSTRHTIDPIFVFDRKEKTNCLSAN